MKNKIFVIGLMLLGSFSLFSQGTTQENYSFSHTIIFCDGPAMVQGNFHFNYNEVSSGGGTYNYIFHANGKGKAVGIGYDAKYEWINSFNYSFNAAKGYTETFVQNFHLIGKGNASNTFIKVRFKLTVNANGSLTVWIDSFEAECG